MDDEDCLISIFLKPTGLIRSNVGRGVAPTQSCNLFIFVFNNSIQNFVLKT